VVRRSPTFLCACVYVFGNRECMPACAMHSPMRGTVRRGCGKVCVTFLSLACFLSHPCCHCVLDPETVIPAPCDFLRASLSHAYHTLTSSRTESAFCHASLFKAHRIPVTFCLSLTSCSPTPHPHSLSHILALALALALTLTL